MIERVPRPRGVARPAAAARTVWTFFGHGVLQDWFTPPGGCVHCMPPVAECPRLRTDSPQPGRIHVGAGRLLPGSVRPWSSVVGSGGDVNGTGMIIGRACAWGRYSYTDALGSALGIAFP